MAMPLIKGFCHSVTSVLAIKLYLSHYFDMWPQVECRLPTLNVFQSSFVWICKRDKKSSSPFEIFFCILTCKRHFPCLQLSVRIWEKERNRGFPSWEWIQIFNALIPYQKHGTKTSQHVQNVHIQPAAVAQREDTPVKAILKNRTCHSTRKYLYSNVVPTNGTE